MTRAFILVMAGAVAFGLFLFTLCDITFRPIWRFRVARKSQMTCTKITGPVVRTGIFGDVPAAADVVDEDAALKALAAGFSAHQRAAFRAANRRADR